MSLLGGIISISNISTLLFVVFAVLLGGYALGRITVKGISLGDAGVFIIALLMGALAFHVNESGELLFALSSKPYDFVRKIAKEQELEELFDGFFCPELAWHLSDKSSLALKAIEHFGENKEETVAEVQNPAPVQPAKIENTETKEKVLLISVDTEEYDVDVSVNELAELVKTAGGETEAVIIQKRPKPDAVSYIGTGKLDEAKEICENAEIDLVVCDGELTPTQGKVLEKTLKTRVIDRTVLILDIFEYIHQM